MYFTGTILTCLRALRVSASHRDVVAEADFSTSVPKCRGPPARPDVPGEKHPTGVPDRRKAFLMTNAPPDPRRWAALVLLCSASFMVILDASIVLVAIPSIKRELDFSAGGVQWVPSAYALTFGGLLLLGGRTADLLGRRRVFMAGTGLFALASLLCGLAWTGDILVLARALQGVAAAVMAPTALSIVMTTFQEGAERNKALGVWGATGGLGGAAGALIGGPVTDGLGWQWIFFINVPVSLLLVALSPVLLRESRGHGRRAFDLTGALTVTAALALLVYAVIQAPASSGGSTLGLIAGSIALIGLFVLVERRSAAPLVPLRIFRSPALVAGNLVTLAFGMSAYGLNFVLTQYAQLVLGYSAVQFGVACSVLAASAIGGSFAGQSLVTRIGLRPVAAGALVLAGIGCTLLSRVTADSGYFEVVFWALVIFGPGLGAGTVAGSIAALSGVAEYDAGVASGVQTASFQVGGALGIAILSGVAAAHSAGVATAHSAGIATAEALTSGYRLAFGAGWVFVAVGLLATGLLLRSRRVAQIPEPVA